MKAVKINETGGPEVLKIEEITLDKPRNDEVLIEHIAIGLNYIDADKMSTHKDDNKFVKVIAGKFENAEGPIKGHNVEPIYFDVELEKNKEFNFQLISTHNSFIYLINGEIKVGKQIHDKIKKSKLILLTKGEKLSVLGLSKAKFLLISGKPIGEQIARGGPFVMNTKLEILQAVQDYHNGTFVKK